MRKIIRATTAAAFAAIVLSAGYAVAAPVCGDVNDDGKVLSSDALLVLQEAVNLPVDLMCGPASQPLKTGQTTCYDGGGSETDCTGTGQDGELRTGVARSFTNNGDGTITDNSTGLMWERLSGADDIHNKDNGYTWAEAFASKVATLNSSNFAGHNDWRVPNIGELQSLVNFGASDPATWSVFNNGCPEGICTEPATCSCTGSFNYWSSSTYRDSATFAWAVLLFDGFTGADDKANTNGVRAVRTGF